MSEIAEDTEHEETRVVHFDLEGAWLANLARTRVKEGDWEHALSMLVDNLQGMTHEQAVAILRGRADLSGWASDKDGLGYNELADDHALAREMDETHAYQYGSMFRWKNDYWKPYAVVDGYNEDDMVFARRQERTPKACGFRETESWQWAAWRALFYANNANQDLVVYVPHPSREFGTVVLCERAKMPPTWFKVPQTDPERHLKAVLAAGARLDARGAFEGQSFKPSKGAKQAPARVRPATVIAPAHSLQSPAELAKEFLERLNQTTTSGEISNLEMEFRRRFDEARDADKSDELIAAEEQARKRMLQAYRTSITEQADRDGGWLELKVTNEDGSLASGGPAVLRIPRNPFLLWCLRDHDFEARGQQRPAWRRVCPSGLKMYGDDVLHTDWVVGAGLEPEHGYTNDGYFGRVNMCAWHLRAKVVQEWSEAQFVTLSRGAQDRIFGSVRHPGPNEAVEAGCIAVIPHAGPEYQLALETACQKDQYGHAGAVICEVGGKLAHLAIVGRERKFTLLMLPHARRLLPVDKLLTIDMKNGTLSG